MEIVSLKIEEVYATLAKSARACASLKRAKEGFELAYSRAYFVGYFVSKLRRELEEHALEHGVLPEEKQ